MKINQLIYSSPPLRKISEGDNRMKLYKGSKTVIKRSATFKFRDYPTDTFIPFHNTVNQLSNSKFGIPIRNLMFTTRSKITSMEYGNVYTITPLGEYDIYFALKISDMTENYKVSKDDILNKLTSIIKSHLSVYNKSFTACIDTINNIVYQHTERNLEETNKYLYQQLAKLLDQNTLDSIQIKIDKVFSKLVHDSKEYINHIQKNNIEEDNIPKDIEIMLYAPDGYDSEFVEKSLYEN